MPTPKPPLLKTVRPLTPSEEQPFKEELAQSRDGLQKIVNEGRRTRTGLQLKARERYIDFLQKLGELSFTFGGALIPLIVVTGSRKDIKTPALVLLGAALYLTNGVLAFWLTKTMIELDGDDAPHVGLDEEIAVFPLIYAKNKLLLEPNNVEHLNDHAQAEWALTNEPEERAKQKRPSVWTDVLLFNFVVASVLVAGTFWPYGRPWYWLTFGLTVVTMVVLIGLDYKRALGNRKRLVVKRQKLAKIRAGFSEWRSMKFFGK